MISNVQRYCGEILSRVIRDLVCFMPVKAVALLDRFCSEMRSGGVKRLSGASCCTFLKSRQWKYKNFIPLFEGGAKLKGLAL